MDNLKEFFRVCAICMFVGVALSKLYLKQIVTGKVPKRA